MALRDQNTPEYTKVLTPEVIALIRKKLPNIIAADIISVQPMDKAMEAYKELYEILKANPNSRLVITSKNIEQDPNHGTQKENAKGDNSKG